MPSIINYMIDEIAVARFLNDDNLDGVPVYAPFEIFKARIERVTPIQRTEIGEDYDVEDWISTLGRVDDRDLVWTAPFTDLNAPRVFAPSPVLERGDARIPRVIREARRMYGVGGHYEFFL